MRNAPRDDAAPQATLWRGDWLEVRGEKAGFLQGVRPPARTSRLHPPHVVRVHRLDEAIGAGAARGGAVPARRRRQRVAGHRIRGAVPARGPGGQPTRARSWRRSGRWRRGWRGAPRRGAPTGVTWPPAARRCRRRPPSGRSRRATASTFAAVDPMLAGGRVRLCYDGEAWERVLARRRRRRWSGRGRRCSSRASECLDPALPAAERRAWNDRRVQALESIDPAAAPRDPGVVAGAARAAAPRRGAGLARLRRGAPRRRWRGVGPRRGRRHPRAGAGRSRRARSRGPRHLRRRRRARRGLALGERGVPPASRRRAARRSRSRRARAGETCVRVGGRRGREGARARASAARTAWSGRRRCAGRAAGNVATMAVQPLPAWTELWVIRRATPRTTSGANGRGIAWSIEPLVAGHRRARRRLRRGRRFFARRRAPAGGARGARRRPPAAPLPDAGGGGAHRRKAGRHRRQAAVHSSAGAPPRGARERWRCDRAARRSPCESQRLWQALRAATR